MKPFEKPKEDTHEGVLLSTDSKTSKNRLGGAIRVDRALFFRKLNRALNKIGKAGQCSVCGGFQPEIIFEHQGKRFYFTCWRIRKVTRFDDKHVTEDTLFETNYEKFLEYLQGTLKAKEAEKQLRACA